MTVAKLFLSAVFHAGTTAKSGRAKTLGAKYGEGSGHR